MRTKPRPFNQTQQTCKIVIAVVGKLVLIVLFQILTK